MEDLIRALPEILRAAGDSEEVAEAAAIAAWRRAAGAGLCEHAAPFRLFRKVLTVAVVDATWQKQLEAMSGQLIFRVNSLLGQAMVTFIEFRIDPSTVERERARRYGAAVNREELARRALCSVGDLREAASEIRDEDLRQKFLLAAGSCIARRND
jgi:hypothetical protein